MEWRGQHPHFAPSEIFLDLCTWNLVISGVLGSVFFVSCVCEMNQNKTLDVLDSVHKNCAIHFCQQNWIVPSKIGSSFWNLWLCLKFTKHFVWDSVQCTGGQQHMCNIFHCNDCGAISSFKQSRVHCWTMGDATCLVWLHPVWSLVCKGIARENGNGHCTWTQLHHGIEFFPGVQQSCWAIIKWEAFCGHFWAILTMRISLGHSQTTGILLSRGQSIPWLKHKRHVRLIWAHNHSKQWCALNENFDLWIWIDTVLTGKDDIGLGFMTLRCLLIAPEMVGCLLLPFHMIKTNVTVNRQSS